MILQDEITAVQALCMVAAAGGRRGNILTGIVTGAGSVLLSPTTPAEQHRDVQNTEGCWLDPDQAPFCHGNAKL